MDNETLCNQMTPQEQIEIGQLSDTEIAKSLQLLIDAYKYSGFESAVLNEAIRRLNPWTTITADPATLPPSGKEVMLSIWRKGKGHAISARWHAKQWLASGGWVVQELDGIPYAWTDWPAPPPYRGKSS
jgi:hypothetical protein